jgi:hypothetical protein
MEGWKASMTVWMIYLGSKSVTQKEPPTGY